ncbi:AraC family transcriptional regulator [Streptomyces sp. NPDC097619]|uniref:helix-turn-helix transcriptional regulator n=1 Tax=Streptomyces sp. NPDC097619 TaxID=3157228 RepID=UPI00331CC205
MAPRPTGPQPPARGRDRTATAAGPRPPLRPPVPLPNEPGPDAPEALTAWLRVLDPDRARHTPTLHHGHGHGHGSGNGTGNGNGNGHGSGSGSAAGTFGGLGSAGGRTDHLVLLVLSGGCELRLPGTRWRLEPGSVCWIRPGTPFTLVPAHRRRTAVRCLRLTGAPAADAALAPAVHAPHAWEVRGLLDLLHAELATDRPHREEHLRGLLLVLFTTVARAAGRRAGGPFLSPAAQRAITEHLDRHPDGRPAAADLAAVARLSPDYFTRLFRNTYGVAPRAWILRERIHRAAVLLDSSDETVTQIARRLGYSDALLFSKQFKSVIGVAPRAYRTRSSDAGPPRPAGDDRPRPG